MSARRARGEALVSEAMARGLTDERREAERARRLGETPRWYSPWIHLAATVATGIVTLAIGAWFLRASAPRASDWLVVPIACVLANFAEWRMHKVVLHRRFRPLRVAYDLHTAMHHMIFVESDMALRSAKELRLVLMPASGVAALVAGTAPIAALVGLAWSAAAGWLFWMTAAACLVGYELLHLSYHLSTESVVGRRWIVRALRRHHARHHDPRLMQRYNFNVTIPLFDWLFGTMAPVSERAP